MPVGVSDQRTASSTINVPGYVSTTQLYGPGDPSTRYYDQFYSDFEANLTCIAALSANFKTWFVHGPPGEPGSRCRPSGAVGEAVARAAASNGACRCWPWGRRCVERGCAPRWRRVEKTPQPRQQQARLPWRSPCGG